MGGRPDRGSGPQSCRRSDQGRQAGSLHPCRHWAAEGKSPVATPAVGLLIHPEGLGESGSRPT
eukprot:11165099-Alexandrium_andersonii.AAC.1